MSGAEHGTDAPDDGGLLKAHNVLAAKAVVAPDGKLVSAPAGTPFTEPQYVIPTPPVPTRSWSRMRQLF